MVEQQKAEMEALTNLLVRVLRLAVAEHGS